MPSRLGVQHADRMEPAGPAEEVHLRGKSAEPGGLTAVSLQTCQLQVFERQSVVEYWEAFARHSFESHTQSVYSHCVLLKPSGEPVPCSFCFTIRRDIFDCPSLIIGKYGSPP